MNILLVEDNYSKIQKIHEVFESDKKPRITSCRSSSEALELLKKYSFEILVVDIQIPDIEGGEVSPTGGIDLISQLEITEDIKAPHYIMGLTVHDSDFESFRTQFLNFGWQLFHMSRDYDKWSKILRNRSRATLNNKYSTTVDAAILTALEHTELEAVLNSNCNWQNVEIDGFSYYLGDTTLTSGEEIKLVAAASERMGVSASAALATRIAFHFQPKLMVMSGICAGVKGKVEIGDIIVADHVWDWNSGKISEENNEIKFLPEPHQIPLKRKVRTKIKSYSVNCPYSESIYSEWKGTRGENLPKLHLAPMACGSQVIANESIMEEILEGNRKMLALDMESYGFLSACETLGINAFVAKSVCDFGDSSKSDGAQDYAAYTSTSFILKFICSSSDLI